MKPLRRLILLVLVTSTGFAKAQLSLFTTYHGKIYPLVDGKKQCENEVPELSGKLQSRGARVLSIGCPPSGPNHVQMIAEINPELPISFDKHIFAADHAKLDFCETDGADIAARLEQGGHTILQRECNKMKPQNPNLTFYTIPRLGTSLRIIEFFSNQPTLAQCQEKNNLISKIFSNHTNHFLVQSLCQVKSYGPEQQFKFQPQVVLISPSEQIPTLFSGGSFVSRSECERENDKLQKAFSNAGESVFLGDCRALNPGFESAIFYGDFISPRVHSFLSRVLYSSLSQCETALEGARNNVGPRTRIIAGFCNEKGPQGYGFTFAYRNVFDPNK